MSLPSLGALAWPPRGDGVRTGMVTDDEEEAPDVAPPAPAPAGIVPPSMLTERQKDAVREYIRSEMYSEYEFYLEQGVYPGSQATQQERKAYKKMMKEWEREDKRRGANFHTSGAATIVNGKADGNVQKAANIIAEQARWAVTRWEEELEAHFDPRDAAQRIDEVARIAAQMVEDYMQQDNAGFFDEEAEERTVEEMAERLEDELDPN